MLHQGPLPLGAEVDSYPVDFYCVSNDPTGHHTTRKLILVLAKVWKMSIWANRWNQTTWKGTVILRLQSLKLWSHKIEFEIWWYEQIILKKGGLTRAPPKNGHIFIWTMFRSERSHSLLFPHQCLLFHESSSIIFNSRNLRIYYYLTTSIEGYFWAFESSNSWMRMVHIDGRSLCPRLFQGWFSGLNQFHRLNPQTHPCDGPRVYTHGEKSTRYSSFTKFLELLLHWLF